MTTSWHSTLLHHQPLLLYPGLISLIVITALVKFLISTLPYKTQSLKHLLAFPLHPYAMPLSCSQSSSPSQLRPQALNRADDRPSFSLGTALTLAPSFLLRDMVMQLLCTKPMVSASPSAAGQNGCLSCYSPFCICSLCFTFLGHRICLHLPSVNFLWLILDGFSA